MFDPSVYNVDNIMATMGDDPFAVKTKKGGSSKDPRFFVLKKDENKKGSAVIRLLPDADGVLIQQVEKINVFTTKNGKNEYFSAFSRKTISPDETCPFQNKFYELWNECKDSKDVAKKEYAKKFGTTTKMVALIKVINDRVEPENNGKIFFYEMTVAVWKKIIAAMRPSQEDIDDLGIVPKNIFNPCEGNSIRLACEYDEDKRMVTYDPTSVIDRVDGAYATGEEYLKDVRENGYLLKSLADPANFEPVEYYEKELRRVTFANVPTTAKVAEPMTNGNTAFGEQAQPNLANGVNATQKTEPVSELNVGVQTQTVVADQPVAQPVAQAPTNTAAKYSDVDIDDMLNNI